MARSVGVPVPKTRKLSQWKDWSQPCIIKSRYSIMEVNNGLFYHKPIYVLPDEPPNFDNVALQMKHDPIVQEHIVGPEYGYSALFNEGKMRAAFQHRRILSLNYMGGASALREPTYVKKLEELGSTLLQGMKWHGPAMVEFKFDIQDKEFKLMEINPRFWGSLNLAVEAGIDFPYLYYKIATHGDCESVYDYRRNIVSHYLAGELSYLASLVRAQSSVRGVSRPSILGQMRLILSTLGHSKFDVLDRKDIAPCLMYLLSICSTHNLRRLLSTF
jgi:predicted ATP-grasp superfamily ATP-dependent carboligase